MASKLDEFHAWYYEKLLPAAKRICKGSKWIEPKDLVHEALLRLFAQPKAFLDKMRDRPADGWLIQVMVNLFCDQTRANVSRRKAQDDPTITRWTLTQGEVEPTFEGITPERFAWAIEQLPQKQRLTFLLHCQELKNQEIARKLGVTEQAVAKRLFDARYNLRRLLQPYRDEGTLQ